MGKQKKNADVTKRKIKELQRHVDDVGEEVLLIESKFCVQRCVDLFIYFTPLGSDVSKKRKREYADGPEDGSIPKPPGTAGKGGGLGYNLQAAMGLSGAENEQIYCSLLVSSILLLLVNAILTPQLSKRFERQRHVVVLTLRRPSLATDKLLLPNLLFGSVCWMLYPFIPSSYEKNHSAKRNTAFFVDLRMAGLYAIC
jgi:hypothetical protein